ncbi:hypothetical protein [Pseudarthrobacter sp. NIBRBAC000502771]|uniref:hypothetical protein n=1 Tax=Pseudarthrobacter sp. NIBRBAC000502771 TaxID=2590774 RepID=UPI0011319B8D|nr:hypothetical protein [Pseudarthrobacter sp. NIBRBAC000502771]QDG63764.1 hypothetical protein NIBR502771_16500 [Pseudarthrobacter sp. NIBRBAC000502771]
MGVRDALARAAVTRCHVFVVEAADGSSARMAVEEDITLRGWVEALSPGDADILCVCGDVPAGEAEAVERLWNQLPGPRSRTRVGRPEDVRALLDGCVGALTDVDHQGRTERDRTSEQGQDDGGMDSHADVDEGGMDSSCGDVDHGDMDDGGMGHEGMDHGDMDHSGMDMPMPGGIPLAGEGKDRDGLDLDVLKVPLGPYLPHWPAGLVLHCELQGDVVFAATAEYAFDPSAAGSDAGPAGRERAVVIHRTDLAARLLTLAGAAGDAAGIRAVRDAVRAGAGMEECLRRLDAVASRLRRNWLLRRTLQGVGRIPHGTAGDSAGTDAWDRLLRMVDAAAGASPAGLDPSDTLPGLVGGQELSVVRLIVASLDLSPTPVPAMEGDMA